MPRPLNESIEALSRVVPSADGEGPWDELDALLTELFAAEASPASLSPAIPALLGIFERFPRHDGYGVLWTVLHGIESIPGYEPAAVEAARRCPTEFTGLLVRRMVNAGVERVGDVELAPLAAWVQDRAPEIDYRP